MSFCSGSQVETCGDIGGTADEGIFNQFFTEMAIVRASDGQPGERDEELGPGYTTAEDLLIKYTCTQSVTIRVCVATRDRWGESVFNEEHNSIPGEGSFNVGSFSAKSYVVRVIKDGVLIKNLPFYTQ